MKKALILVIIVLISALTGFSQSLTSGNITNLITQDARMGDYKSGYAFTDTVSYEVRVPNAFSPNGDGINDYFKIPGIEHYPEARLYVYTTSNRKVFEKTHYGNLDYWGSEADALWDGSNNLRGVGLQLPNGTYIYILDLANGNQKLIKLGTVFIKR